MNRNAVIGLVLAAFVIVVGISFIGGGSSDGPDESAAPTTTTVSDAPVTSAPSTAGPTECAPLGEIPPAEGKPTTVDLPTEPTTGDVQVTVLEEGDGPAVTDASYVTVDYLGVACASGEQFDSSWDRGEPITIAMPGATPTETAFTVIPGWNEGLEGQAQGSLVQLDIPSDLAYGADGGQGIAPNDPLTFVIEVLEVSDTAPAA
ncbi:FKBP-type peptidyl-prolyl cis-trans isomerase [Aquihabitans daechungensis]|uniref:FKBP-type peptidyl-prolyl cis-trans isomerase n=1 Tax=Aquihabitans daechungensis TaxID=1052257 RepID=UPI003BA38FE6